VSDETKTLLALAALACAAATVAFWVELRAGR
jgi:hypothetical protein